MEHLLPSKFLSNTVSIVVVGAGGTGSQMVTALARLHHALKAFGHPYGFNVKLVDDDIVSETNLLRQAFLPCDIGRNKATVLINRLNMTFGLDWKSDTTRVDTKTSRLSADIVIGCVDTRGARKAIYEASNRSQVRYWLDCGNSMADGQCILGELEESFKLHGGKSRIRLPHAADLYPDVIDERLDAKDEMPSCSMAEALEKQSLFVNSEVVLSAANILFEFFRSGKISFHGNYFNLKLGKKLPLMVDPESWKRMGYFGSAK